jgi:hypothetical protein
MVDIRFGPPTPARWIVPQLQPMRIDPTAAAYGLFQVAFADMTFHLATALLAIRRHRDPSAEFSAIPWQFERLVEQIKEELKQFDRSMASEISDIRRACARAKELAGWRSARIHARVRQVEDGLTLYDWVTGKPLSITQQDCEKNILAVGMVIAEFQANFPLLLNKLDLDKAIDEVFAKLSES